jgi:Ca2+-binding RTX toxin-like protein
MITIEFFNFRDARYLKTVVLGVIGSDADAVSNGNGIGDGGEDDTKDEKDKRNAIGHAITSAEIALGPDPNILSPVGAPHEQLAKILGDAKEVFSDDPADSAKDQVNNAAGRAMAKYVRNLGLTGEAAQEAIDDLVMDALNSGKLQTDKNAPPPEPWTGPSSENWQNSSSGRDYSGTMSTYHVVMGIGNALNNMMNEVSDFFKSLGDMLSKLFNINSPIVLDLDGDGVEDVSVAASTALFDINNDGFADHTAWIKGDDGFLVRDLNNNGTIDNQSEMFGNDATYLNGYLKLKTLDTNNDNAITSADNDFATLKVWRDLNQDGVSQSTELFTLSSLGITSIRATAASSSQVSANGNGFYYQSTFLMNGVSRNSIDVFFNVEAINTEYTGSVAIDPRVLFLPDLRGYGQLMDLHLAMSVNETLLQKVQALAVTPLEQLFSSSFNIAGKIDDILYRWAGVENVDPNIRLIGSDISNFDMRDYQFLQKFDPFVAFYNQSLNASSALARVFDDFGYAVLARILVQSNGAQLFTERGVYDSSTDTFSGTWHLNLATFQNLVNTVHPTGPALKDFWLSLFEVINHTVGLTNLTTTEITTLDTMIQQSDASHVLTFAALQQTITTLNAPIDEVWKTNWNYGGDDQNNLLLGNYFADTIQARGGNDMIFGGNGADTIYGGNGNDVLVGEAGNNTLYGQAGDDTYYLNANFGEAVIEVAGEGFDTVMMAAGITPDMVGAYNDFYGYRIFLLSNPSVATWLYDNTQIPSAARTTPIENIVFSNGVIWNLAQGLIIKDTDAGNTQYLTGSTLNDTISGNGGDDWLYGQGGNDTLNGGAGSDLMNGADGDDTYYYQSGLDRVTETTGNDQVIFAAGLNPENMIFSNSGADSKIVINAGINELYFTQFHAASNPKITEKLVFDDGFSLTYGRFNTADWITNNTGTINADTLIGGTAADTINGGTGIDEISGGAGADILDGGDGDDLIHGGSGNDTITGAAGLDKLWGGDGNDSLDGGAANDRLMGGLGDDKYIYLSGADKGMDTINDAGGTADWISLGSTYTSANTSVVRVGQYDLAVIGAGTQRLLIENQFTQNGVIEKIRTNDGVYLDLTTMTHTVDGTSANETLYGTSYGAGGDILNGLGGDDVIYAGLGNDTVSGGDGNDTLYGEDGNDALYGGLGNDTFVYDGGVDMLTDTGGTDQISITTAGLSATNATLVRNGTQSLDVMLNGTLAMTLSNQFVQDQGFETISFADGSSINLLGTRYTTDGTTSDDTLTGLSYGAGGDILNGLAGNDTINAGLGNDTLDGGLGNDSLYGQGGNDTYIYNGGTDTVFENANDGFDILSVTTLAPTGIVSWTDATGLYIQSSALSTDKIRIDGIQDASGALDVGNRLEQIVFNDGTIWNLAQGLTINDSGSGRTMFGSTGNDLMNGNGGNDTLYSYAGDDTLTGGTGTDFLYGGDGNDWLQGDGSGDTLYGEAGDDILLSDAGKENMYGGLGADTFKFATTTFDATIDAIKDFSVAGGDHLDIHDILTSYDPLTSAITNFIELTTSGANTVMKIDRDGTGASYTWTQIATIEGVTGLTDEQALLTGGTIVT